MKIHLVLQSYGNENEYRRSIFSIWSYFAHTTIEETEVSLFTDNIDWVKPYLEGLTIRFVPLSKGKITMMRGEIDFVHRVKIAVIEEAFNYSQDKMLYLDSDTFFIRDPRPFMEKVSPGVTYMHKEEYQFSEMKKFPLPSGETFHRYYEYAMNRAYKMQDGTSIQISPDQISWNAGVILLDQHHRNFLPDVYTLTEETYPSTKNHGCEQYGFSIVLGTRTSVNSCFDMVYHYWRVVKKNIADKFLVSKIDSSWCRLSHSQKLDTIRSWTRLLPSVFETDTLRYQDESILAFTDNRFGRGYKMAAKAMVKGVKYPFIRNVIYHTARFLKLKAS